MESLIVSQLKLNRRFVFEPMVIGYAPRGMRVRLVQMNGDGRLEKEYAHCISQAEINQCTRQEMLSMLVPVITNAMQICVDMIDKPNV